MKLITLLLGFALAMPLAMVACGGGGPQERTFELEIREQSLVREESVLRVKQDDIVTIVVTADVNLEFHLHGYDIELDVETGEPATMKFTADATGSFRFTIHIEDEEHEVGVENEEEGEEIELGRLEVQPR